MKAIGYIRVSTEDQAREGVSLDNQEARIKAYCESKGFNLIDIIQDEGISGGKNKGRDGFVYLLDKIETGEAGVIILYSLERLSRDMLTLLALERLLDEYDIELHTSEGQIDTSTPDGFMNFAIKAFLGEMERRQVKYRTKKAMEYKKNRQEVVGSIPYGYRRDGDNLIEDLKEQKVIHLVNDLYHKGARLIDIVNELEASGHRTRTGREFSPQQVKRIINDYQRIYQKKQTRFGQTIRSFVMAVA